MKYIVKSITVVLKRKEVENMGQKQKTKRSLKDQFILNILSWYQNKGIKITNEAAIIGALQECFIVDKKYQKICEYIMNHYEKTQNNTKSSKYRIKYYSLLFAFVLYAFLNHTNLKLVIAEEDIASMLKDIKIEITGEEINEIDKIYIAEAQKAEEERILKEQLEELQKRIEEEKRIAEEQERIRIEEENQRMAIYDSFLEEYSEYFHLNAEKVKELAKMTTNNYEDFASILPNKDFDFTNFEAICMLFVYYLNRDELTTGLNEFGISKEDLLTTTEIETLSYDNIDDLILKTGEGYTTFLGRISDLFNINDKSLLLSLSFSEIDKLDSNDISRTKNNFGGLRYKSGEYMTFPTPEAGIISLCGIFKQSYNHYNINSIQEFARHYVNGPKGEPNEYTQNWAKNVQGNYYEISENYDFYFNTENDKDYTLVRTRNE